MEGTAVWDSSNTGLVADLLGEIQLKWSGPVGKTLKLSYAVECGKKSVMTYT